MAWEYPYENKEHTFFSLAVIAIFAVSLSYAFRNIESPAKPESKISSASLPSLVRYYESQLDPSIPRITVTAEHDEERYELPYDASFVSGDGEPQAAVNCTWFVNLINNFWSLPELVNEKGGYGGMSPAQFTISFCEQPEGEVSIIDYCIYSEYGYVNTYFVENKPEYSAKLLKKRTRTFTPENGKVSFEL